MTDFVVLPSTDEEWNAELKGFRENYMYPMNRNMGWIPCSSGNPAQEPLQLLTQIHSHQYGLIRYNKRFLNLTCNAPGSTHDSRLLTRSRIYSQIQAGQALPNSYLRLDLCHRSMSFGDSRTPPSPQHAWLVKALPNTNDPKKRYFNTKLCGARVLTENAYGMLKGRWRFIYKKM